MKLSEKAYVNWVTLLCHTGIDTVLGLAYILEMMKGARSLGYICIFEILCFVPVIAEWMVYKKNRESKYIMYMLGVFYSILYTYSLFTASSTLNFVYIVPLLMVITLYSNVRFCITICGVSLLINAVDITNKAISVGYSSDQITDVEIRVACLLLMAVYSAISTGCLNKLNRHKLANLNAEKEKSTQMLNNTLELAEHISQGIGQVTDKMERLGQSVMRIQDSMKEVTEGSGETADSVQHQLIRTEEIQNHISKVKESAEDIDRGVENAAGMIEDGQKNIDAMAEQVQKSMAANETVISRMAELSAQTEKMNTIIEMITGITNQTSLLSLNASIEAARAGEAGRGFAVVAGEISSLANQTKSATVSITELIQNINAELKEVSEAIDQVTGSNQSHAVTAEKVLGSFEKIAEMTEHISQQTGAMKETVTELEKANADIVENIQTISAITEEVSAHSSETYSACEENSGMVSEVTGIVEELHEETKKIQKSY